MFKKEKGFTLIELMIVVAIIGILAAVAIPRFGSMIKKAKEGATKGNLGALRSALSMYYGEQEGYYPAVATAGDRAGTSSALYSLVTKDFMEAIPGLKGVHNHADTTSPNVYEVTFGSVTVAGHTADTNAAKWGYSVNSGRTTAVVYVNCDEIDLKGDTISGW